MNNVDVVTFTIIFDQVQSLIWFKIFVKQKKTFVCIDEIKFAIISKFLLPVNFGILSGGFSHFICRGILLKVSSRSSLFCQMNQYTLSRLNNGNH